MENSIFDVTNRAVDRAFAKKKSRENAARCKQKSEYSFRIDFQVETWKTLTRSVDKIRSSHSTIGRRRVVWAWNHPKVFWRVFFLFLFYVRTGKYWRKNKYGANTKRNQPKFSRQWMSCGTVCETLVEVLVIWASLKFGFWTEICLICAAKR